MSAQTFAQADTDSWYREALNNRAAEPMPREQAADELQGFYWWLCFPGGLPDGDPIGPFDTEADAIADARGSDVRRYWSDNDD